MRWSILFTIACGCSISACHIEHLDCGDDDAHCCRGPWDENPYPEPDAGDRAIGTGRSGSGGGHSDGNASTGGDKGTNTGAGGASAGSGGSNSGAGGASAGSGGSTPGAGGASAGSGGSNSGAGGANPGSGGTDTDAGGASKPMPCTVESDCARGYNCDTTRGECLPTDAETCPELTTEASCSVRNDCTTVYAGTNCTCGPDCQCTGGEPGCICERFEFFRCAAIE